jgi:hypothetical protein
MRRGLWGAAPGAWVGAGQKGLPPYDYIVLHNPPGIGFGAAWPSSPRNEGSSDLAEDPPSANRRLPASVPQRIRRAPARSRGVSEHRAGRNGVLAVTGIHAIADMLVSARRADLVAVAVARAGGLQMLAQPTRRPAVALIRA